MILGYLDLSGKNVDADTQRRQIVQYAAENDYMIDMFVQGEDIETLQTNITSPNHTILIANIVALGTTLWNIKDKLSLLAQMRLSLVSVKESYNFAPEDLNKLCESLELALHIRNSLSSIITKKALADRKTQGIRLGRKTPNKKHVFDGKEEFIKQKLAQRVAKTQIAKDLGVSQAYLYAFLKKHPELKSENTGDENA